MGWRISLILIIALSWAAVGVTWFVKNPPETSSDPKPPYFYTLPSSDITRIEISVDGESVSWHLREEPRSWFFDEPEGIPVNLRRWGGITTLLGGPQTQRRLTDEIGDPAEFGLDDPNLSVRMTLRDGSLVGLDMGDLSPDGRGHYARLHGFPQLVMVDSSWGDVLVRLVREPPLPEWYYTMDPLNATEVLFFLKNVVVRGYGYDDENPAGAGWYLCDLPVADDPCVGTQPLDEQGVQDILSQIAARKFIAAEALGLKDEEAFEPYGTDLNAPYVYVRLEDETSSNITTITSVSLSLGDMTPNESEMFIRANDSDAVVRADAEWGGAISQLFKDPPPLASP